LFDRARDLKHNGVCFITIGQGNQKLRQFEYWNFSPIFGRATLYKCITAGCEMWHQNAWFFSGFLNM
jgi:hypothetical protein